MKTRLYEVLAVCLVSLVVGCAVIKDKRDAKRAMLESKETYKSCLKKNLEAPDKCKGYKALYELDLKAYQTLRSSPESVVIKDAR
jgi:hypothetical protein